MRKNDLVKLNIAKCFTMEQGGKLDYPLSNYRNDTDGTVEGHCLATAADVSAWYASDDSKGIDCAGESKLPPTSYIVSLERDKVYTLLRARCRPVWSYREHPGMAMVLCTETGNEVYIKRELIEVAS
jgi:hypothetical protein